MAVVYALCVMAAPVAIAEVDSAAIAHGLAGDHPVAGALHLHADGSAYHHGDHGVPCDHDDNGHAANCCGLLCLTALGVDVGVVFGHDVAGAIAAPVVAADLPDRGPDRLIRPPIAPLSI